YDAGTERLIKNWSTSIVMIAVRDSRLHEVDPLIGVVVLPLRQLFTNRGRSQVTDSFPLIQPSPEDMHIPREMTSWDVGTLELNIETTRASGNLPHDLKSARILFRTLYGREKVLPVTDGDGGWRQKRNRPIQLAVKNRYASCLLIQFRKTALGPDKTPAFGTLWLKGIPDVEEVTVRVAVRRNQGKDMVRGRFNVSEDIGERIPRWLMLWRFCMLRKIRRSFRERYVWGTRRRN
ncbi:hypothetical protein BT96DRAFT_1079957, partial [Gymnopus androsaceus JB14]